jgi:Rieske Fe-S protein
MQFKQQEIAVGIPEATLQSSICKHAGCAMNGQAAAQLSYKPSNTSIP